MSTEECIAGSYCKHTSNSDRILTEMFSKAAVHVPSPPVIYERSGCDMSSSALGVVGLLNFRRVDVVTVSP